MGGGRGRDRRLSVRPAVEPVARPVGVACWGPARVPRRAGRSLAGAAAAAALDPRRRARTGRPGRPARGPDPHPDQTGLPPARAVQPARSAIVASPVAAGRAGCGSCAPRSWRSPRPRRRSCWSSRDYDCPRSRSRCCTGGPAAGSPVCGWPPAPWRSPPTARRCSPTSPETTARWPTTWSGRSCPGCRRPRRSSCA